MTSHSEHPKIPPEFFGFRAPENPKGFSVQENSVDVRNLIISEHRKLLFAILLSRRILMNFLHPKNASAFFWFRIKLSFLKIKELQQRLLQSPALHLLQPMQGYISTGTATVQSSQILLRTSEHLQKLFLSLFLRRAAH